MSNHDDSNVTRLGVKMRLASPDGPPLSIVSVKKCQHIRIEVDETLAQVECKDCGERLDPMAVLLSLAKADSRLARKRDSLRSEVESYKDRLKFKCGGCGQVNNITKPLRTRTTL
jgi:predicted RNA-binding Zn-ribbon protein involved in translation (DUF1610 family)